MSANLPPRVVSTCQVSIAGPLNTLTVNELGLGFRRYAREYCQKIGKVTREATLIDDVIRVLREYNATSYRDLSLLAIPFSIGSHHPLCAALFGIQSHVNTRSPIRVCSVDVYQLPIRHGLCC